MNGDIFEKQMHMVEEKVKISERSSCDVAFPMPGGLDTIYINLSRKSCWYFRFHLLGDIELMYALSPKS